MPERYLQFMKPFLHWVFLLLLFGCSSEGLKLSQLGEFRFRTTYNLNRELTDAELDSLQKSMPEYMETGTENQLYDLFIQKGIVSDNKLDTSSLNLNVLSVESPHLHLSELEFDLETVIPVGRQYLHIKRGMEKFTIDLGQSLLGDRWLSLLDIDDDGKFEILLLEKYYVMGGDNFDLKIYRF